MVDFKKTLSLVDRELLGDYPEADIQRTFMLSKEYILVRNLLEEIHPILIEGEVIKGYIPLSNAQNNSVFSTGWLGMSYARKAETKEYIGYFSDIRGNRLLVFTDTRIIFFVISEFYESGTYYSYPYQTIKGIKLKKHTSLIKKHSWYTFDFQSNNHIFTEFFTEEDTELFYTLVQKTPELQAIKISGKVTRNNLFDLVFSNGNLFVKIGYAFSFILALLAIVFVIWIIRLVSQM